MRGDDDSGIFWMVSFCRFLSWTIIILVPGVNDSGTESVLFLIRLHTRPPKYWMCWEKLVTGDNFHQD